MSSLAWQDTWHLWRIVIPRRSTAGEFVWGQVWRRRNDDQWQYRKVVEYYDVELPTQSVSDGDAR
jgi:hypothetical protein